MWGNTSVVSASGAKGKKGSEANGAISAVTECGREIGQVRVCVLWAGQGLKLWGHHSLIIQD